MSVETLAQALLEAGILDAMSVEMRVPRARTGRKLLDDIVSDGVVTETSLVNQLARALSVPRYDPKERQPEPDALALLDLRVSDDLGVLPVAVRGGGALLWVAMCDPTDEALLQDIQRRSGRRVKACLIGPRELTRALHQLGAGGGAAPAPPPAPPAGTTTGQFRTMPPPPQQQMQQAPQMQQPMTQPQMQQMQMPQQMPMMPQQPMNPMGYGMMPNGMGMMPGQFPSYGYSGQVPLQPGMQAQQAPMTQPPAPPAARPGELQRLEEELAQAKQVVKVLVQLLVERGAIDGEELKRRLRAERDRR